MQNAVAALWLVIIWADSMRMPAKAVWLGAESEGVQQILSLGAHRHGCVAADVIRAEAAAVSDEICPLVSRRRTSRCGEGSCLVGLKGTVLADDVVEEIA
ncbi:MAG: hypothetical protein K1X78_02850 [Verrucomicrobiaceae bacterium]|nr:hypothetical protein [Verrucomicrobiaceae bacterium]